MLDALQVRYVTNMCLMYLQMAMHLTPSCHGLAIVSFPKIVSQRNEKKILGIIQDLVFIMETEYLLRFVCSFLRLFSGDLSLTLCKALMPELEEKASRKDHNRIQLCDSSN